MSKFNYTAINKEGKTVKGTIEAKDRAEARELLVKQSLKPSALDEQASKKSFLKANLQLGAPGVKLKDKVVFTRQLSTLINAGVPLVRSLNTLTQQTESKGLKVVLPQVTKQVEGGASLADALNAYPKVFGDIFVNMVRAGEAGGILDSILERLAVQQEKDASIRGKLKSAMTYPSVILSITFVAFIFLMTTVVPKIGKIITDLAGDDYTPPIYTRVLLSISDFMVSYGVVLIILFVILGFAFIKFIHTPKGRFAFHTFLLKVPVVKNIITKVAIARFARTFSALSAAGVGVLDSLQVTGKAVGNAVIQKDLEAAATAVRNGKPLSEPLLASNHFPPIVSQMIAIGEETGEIEDILTKLADFYEEEVERVAGSLTSIIEPIMIVILGSIIGVIALSVFGPISSITQQI